MWKTLKILHIRHVRNVRFLHMTDVEKSENSPHGLLLHFMLLLLQKSFFCKLRCFVAKSVCRDLRVFVWRKIEPKIVYVEKKWQISGMCHIDWKTLDIHWKCFFEGDISYFSIIDILWVDLMRKARNKNYLWIICFHVISYLIFVAYFTY